MFLIDKFSMFLQQIGNLSKLLSNINRHFFYHIGDRLSLVFFDVIIHAK
jgi:hypothetical protein